MVIKVIVLDRDGVINQDSPSFIKSPDEWQAIPGSLEAIAKLNRYGYKVVVATNQSGLARGYFAARDLDEIHRRMTEQLAAVGGHLDGIFICPHGPQDECECRKPKPGLLLDIAKNFGVQPDEMFVVGDSMRDLIAAQSAGCQRGLVRTGNGVSTELEIKQKKQANAGDSGLGSVAIFDNLSAVAGAIVFLQMFD